MKKIVAMMLGILLFFSTAMEIQAVEEPKESELYAKAAVLMDADSGRVLYAKNAEEPLANASTTKILTCILILENCNLEDVAEASSNAASQPRVRLGVKSGQRFFVKDMLYALMLESFNDCAVILAEHMAGTVENFAECMNQKAAEIGCTDSYFITPNGLDGKNENGIHHTTAKDLAKIMRYCIKTSPQKEMFLEITRTANHTFSDAEGTVQYSCTNHNAFLQMMEGALTGKTGFTGTAGYCYTGALKRDGKTLIVALLACGWPNHKTYKWSDTKTLMQYGLEGFQIYDVSENVKGIKDLPEIYVSDGTKGWIGEKTKLSLVLQNIQSMDTILIKEGENLEAKVQMKQELFAPIRKGTVVGTVTYWIGEELIRKDSILAGENITKIDFSWCFRQVLELADF